MSEQSDGDRTADGLQKVDGRQNKHSSPGLNSIIEPVNGKQIKTFDRDLIVNERTLPSPCSGSEGERMSSAQTVDADGSMANGQESPVNIDDVENENVVNAELDIRRVWFYQIYSFAILNHFLWPLVMSSFWVCPSPPP